MDQVLRRQFVRAIGALLISAQAWSQTPLRTCKGQVPDWTNCVVTYPNGDKYAGEVRDGKPNGQGSATLANGKIQSGTWEHGKFIEKK